MRLTKAKKTAFQTLATVIKLQLRAGKPAGLRRIESFSFYIQEQLGEDLQPFVAEQHKLRSANSNLRDINVRQAVASCCKQAGCSCDLRDINVRQAVASCGRQASRQ